MNPMDPDFDLSKYDPDKVEKDMASGGMIPAGFYRARLDGAMPVTSKQNQTPGWELTFTVLGGDHDGATVQDTMWISDKAQSINRALLFQHRLGVIRRSAETGRFERVPDVTDFRDTVGKVEVIIHVKHEEYDRRDGGKGTALRLEFNGIYAKDDAKAAEKVGKPLPEKAGAGQGGSSATGTTAPATTSKAKAESDAAAKRKAELAASL